MGQAPLVTPSIVVGIGGSIAAINTAKWAVVEATTAGFHCICWAAGHNGHAASCTEIVDIDLEYAETALRAAAAAVRDRGRSITIETAVVPGSPDKALIDETHDAEMICVGSVGIGHLAETSLDRQLLRCPKKPAAP
ncbi:universal stress protein [Mycobacterium noviomagense]|uniref:UspA domain-containing protein n=1 Tax=Mycobacterium noviomagense TaxID=459858 RepID=A0A7I7PID4_9MYCO|nr:universal stress protein [Mycobacterium noviomagense]BBY08260.1 hypothetical protein MNVI_35780 [Mycobacterium noviomagense]